MKTLCIIGAQRAGTTMLYNILEEHPNIRMAKPLYPEPKFFLKANINQLNKEWYINYYYPNLKNDETIIGEKSTSYIEHPQALMRMKEMFPDINIIVMLREPVARAISNYYFSKKNNIETRSIKNVFIKNDPPPKIAEEISTSPFNYLSRGIYIEYLKNVFEIFNKYQLYICFYEDFISCPRREIERLTGFLGINNIESRRIFDFVNQATSNESMNAEILEMLYPYFRKSNQQLAAFLQRELPEEWRY